MPCPGTCHKMAPFESMRIFEVNGATCSAVPSQTETFSLYSKILTRRWCSLQVAAGQTSAKRAQILPHLTRAIWRHRARSRGFPTSSDFLWIFTARSDISSRYIRPSPWWGCSSFGCTRPMHTAKTSYMILQTTYGHHFRWPLCRYVISRIETLLMQ